MLLWKLLQRRGGVDTLTFAVRTMSEGAHDLHGCTAAEALVETITEEVKCHEATE